MSITLSSGSDSSHDIQIDNLKDLVPNGNNVPTVLKLAEAVVAGLNQPVSSAAALGGPFTLSYQSGNPCWTLGDYTFGLSGGVSGTIEVLPPGQDLIGYTKTFPTTIGSGLDTNASTAKPGKITAPPGNYYVLVALKMTLAANGAAKVQLGQVGIQGTAATDDAYEIKFFKSVAGDTLLEDALRQAFEGFVLPLHAQTFQHLEPGDYLYHQFNATLNLGFGASLGLNETYFSGQYKAAIPDSPAATPAVTLSACVGLTVDGSLGATFKYTDSFEAMLWLTDSNTAHLHLYKNHSTDPSFTAAVTIGIQADPAVSIAPLSLSSLAQQALPGGTGAVVSQILNGAAQDQVNTWVGDAQTKIDSWLKPLQSGKVQLQATIEDLDSSYLLLDVTFALAQPGFSPAWSEVLAGDFQSALKQSNGAMSLDPGSGLESFHHQKTDVTFKLFGKFQEEWTSSQITNYSVLYAGNNTFKLVENIGLQNITNVDGSGREVDLYFAAQGTQTVAGGLTLAPPDLHVFLKATNNPKFGNAIAQCLGLAATGTVAAQLRDQLVTSVKKGNSTQTVELIFDPGAYGALTSSTLNSDGTIANENLDTANYDAFAAASWESQPGVIADVSNFSVQNKLDLTYDVWRRWNMTAIGKDPDRGTNFPQRRPPAKGNPPVAASPDSGGDWDGSDAVAFLDQQFQSPALLQFIPFVLIQASGFMDLCEDLKNLAALAASDQTSWDGLCADLGYIVHHDVPADYLVPTGYALTKLATQAGAQAAVSGPSAGAANEPAIAVTLRFSTPAS